MAAHNGAEIRTEGDSFYVVFPSASMAVACALEIVRAAADDVVHDDPILVGVGVHAGEALDTPEGPVGTAVNIAARLCAIAGPGEVVVSDTVRALTRSVGSAGFVALGRKPIKGLDESLSLYRAVPAGTVVARPRRRTLRPMAASIVGFLAVAALGFIALVRPSLPGSPAVGASPSVATRLGRSLTDRPVGHELARRDAGRPVHHRAVRRPVHHPPRCGLVLPRVAGRPHRLLP